MWFKKPVASGSLRPSSELLRTQIRRVCVPCRWRLWFRPVGPVLGVASADLRGSILAGEQNLATLIQYPRWSSRGELRRETSAGPARLAIAAAEKTVMACAQDDLRTAWKSFRTNASLSVPALRSLLATLSPVARCLP